MSQVSDKMKQYIDGDGNVMAADKLQTEKQIKQLNDDIVQLDENIRN
jgi:hypothetical protein